MPYLAARNSRRLPRPKRESHVAASLSSLDILSAAGVITVANLLGRVGLVGLAMYGLIHWLLK